jgi:small subunit ribosomal protein S21
MKMKNDFDVGKLVESGGRVGTKRAGVQLNGRNYAAPRVVDGGFYGRSDHTNGYECHSIYDTAILKLREAGELRLAEVHIQDGETLESALRRFKRKVQQEDIIKEIKRHSFYLKPGEKKRTKEALARKRNRKKRTRDVE